MKQETEIKLTRLIPTDIGTISYEEFNKIPTYDTNRAVEGRVEALKVKVCKENLQFAGPFREIAIGVATKDFFPYKKGDRFLLNGNTRKALFLKYEELIPQAPFNVTYSFLENEIEALITYYSYDNTSNSEKSTDKLTGFIRRRNYEPYSTMMSTGKINQALSLACNYTNDENGNYLNPKNKSILEQQRRLDYFWRETKVLDKLNFDILKKENIWSSELGGALLLILKKYGLNDKRVNLMLTNLWNQISTYSKNGIKDGVDYVFNHTYKPKVQKTRKNDSGYTISTANISNILYSLDSFIQNKKITSDFGTTEKDQKMMLNFYKNYLKEDGDKKIYK